MRNMVHLVDDLLDVSRLTMGKIRLRKERVELGVVFERSVATSRAGIDQRQQELSVSLPSEAIWLEGDPVRLEQVLTNLLTNAAKYTDPGGRIELLAQRDGSEVVIQVKDNGIGIDPDLLPRIFDLFTQANRSLDRSQGGLGIGLTVAHDSSRCTGAPSRPRAPVSGRGATSPSAFPLDRPWPSSLHKPPRPFHQKTPLPFASSSWKTTSTPPRVWRSCFACSGTSPR